MTACSNFQYNANTGFEGHLLCNYVSLCTHYLVIICCLTTRCEGVNENYYCICQCDALFFLLSNDSIMLYFFVSSRLCYKIHAQAPIPCLLSCYHLLFHTLYIK